MSTSIAATLFASFAFVVILFQLALACGAPWGEWTMAEKFSGRLPHQLRVASLIQASLIGFAVLVVEVRAGQLWTHWFTLSQKLIWAVVFLFAVATLLNFITPSKKERALWFPIAAVLLMSSFFVAMN